MQIKLHITVDQLVECLGKKALRTIRSLDGGFAHHKELGRLVCAPRGAWKAAGKWLGTHLKRFGTAAQGVQDHRDRAEGHGGGGPHWVEQQTVDWKKNAGGNRNSYEVVKKCPKKILADKPYGVA